MDRSTTAVIFCKVTGKSEETNTERLFELEPPIEIGAPPRSVIDETAKMGTLTYDVETDDVAIVDVTVIRFADKLEVLIDDNAVILIVVRLEVIDDAELITVAFKLDILIVDRPLIETVVRLDVIVELAKSKFVVKLEVPSAEVDT